MRKEVSEFAHQPGITQAFLRSVRTNSLQVPQMDQANSDWICWQSGLPYLPLDIEIPWQMIQQEARVAMPHMLAQPITSHDSCGWTNLGIYSRGAEDPGDYHGPVQGVNDWTVQALTLMPNTVKYLQEHWPHAQFHKIRLLGLEPNGVIGLHKDDCHGLDNINIAIDHPQGCEFAVEGAGIVPFENGKAFMINVGRRHAVVNPTPYTRLHITIYQSHDKQMKDLIEKSYEKLCATG
jgi:hypothetical protein